MMMYMLLVVVAMAMSVNAGERYKVNVEILNPKHEDTLDKYGCCWGDYYLKLVFQKGMLDWYRIETQPPDNYQYQEKYDTNYQIPMGRQDKRLGPLTGYVLRYGRLQGENWYGHYYISSGTIGFYGIGMMTIKPRNDVAHEHNSESGPSCVYRYPYTRDNETIPLNQQIVACMYNRPMDEEANNMVKKAFPSVTFFDSILPYRPTNGAPNSIIAGHMSAGYEMECELKAVADKTKYAVMMWGRRLVRSCDKGVFRQDVCQCVVEDPEHYIPGPYPHPGRR